MARFSSIVLATVLAGCCGLGVALGDAPATKPASEMKAKPKMAKPEPLAVAPEVKAALGNLAQQYSDMGYHLKLTEDQRAKLKDQFEAMIKDLLALHDAAVKKSKDERAAIEPTTGAERDKLRQQLQEDNSKAQSDFQDSYMAHQMEINATLTAAQRVEWETFKIDRSLNQLMRTGPEITAAQWKSLKPIVDDAAKELAEAKDGAVVRATTAKLMKKVIADVFTDDQMAHLLAALPSLTGLAAVPPPKAAHVDKDLP